MAPMLNPDLLRSFLAVAEMRSFALALQRLGLRQSTVSRHIKRLEAALHRRLLARDTHATAPTPDGDAVVDFARQILDANERIGRFFAGPELRGGLRFGISEDFVLSELEEVLAEFAQRHTSGDLDVIFVKRRTGDTRGQTAWREQLV